VLLSIKIILQLGTT